MGCDSLKCKKQKRSKPDLDSLFLVSDNNVLQEKEVDLVFGSENMRRTNEITKGTLGKADVM